MRGVGREWRLGWSDLRVGHKKCFKMFFRFYRHTHDSDDFQYFSSDCCHHEHCRAKNGGFLNFLNKIRISQLNFFYSATRLWWSVSSLWCSSILFCPISFLFDRKDWIRWTIGKVEKQQLKLQNSSRLSSVSFRRWSRFISLLSHWQRGCPSKMNRKVVKIAILSEK